MVAVNEPSALELVGGVVADAAAAVAANLPGSPTPHTVREGVDGVSLGAGATAVSGRLSGAASGALVVALSGPVAAALVDGPLGQQDLVAALQTSMADAVAALEPTFGSPLRLDAPYEVDADLALSSLQGAVLSVPLLAGDGLAAVVAISVDVDADGDEVAGSAMEFPDLAGHGTHGQGAADPASLELLADVEMGVTAELGRTRMTVRHLLALAPGSVVELDRVAGSAVDLLVNGTLIARGEVVVIDDEFGVRVTEIVGRTNGAGERRRR